MLEKKTGITVCDHPTRYLVLNNCGLMCGGSYESILDELGKYGDIEDIVLLPGQQFAFVAFRDVADCVSAAAFLSTRPSRLVADGSVHPAFVDKVPEHSSCGAPFLEHPPGLRLVREAVDEAEEALLWRLVSWDRDCRALKQREVRHFGYAFDYELQGVRKDAPLAEPIPEECAPFLGRLVASGHLSGLPDQLTVTRYLPGQGIPPHVDSHGSFEDGIVCLSLGSPVVMDFRHPDGDRAAVLLPPRSALLLHGPSRYIWTHGTASRKSDVVPRTEVPGQGLTLSPRGVRISFTFRRIRRGDCGCGHDLLCDSSRLTKSDREAMRLEEEHVYQVYESIAEQFSGTRHREWPRVAAFVEALEPGSLLLDAGCGNGKYLLGHPHVLKVGFDRSGGLAAICRSRNLEVVQADTLDVPFRSGVFDACLSIAVLHHLATPERREAAVREILRLLRPGGRALIYVWALEQAEGAPSKYLKASRNASRTLPSGCEQTPGHLPVHANRTQFEARDMLVPWHSKGTEEVHYRYYHLFERDELSGLLERVSPGCVLEEYHDQGNWQVLPYRNGFKSDRCQHARTCNEKPERLTSPLGRLDKRFLFVWLLFPQNC
ncbi:methyltransferase, putative [Ixodes scapularis]|uniref:Methyltransferase, putative n=1 Tax=Ixodes scapularis TaxID=6945 RepID=B7QP17_IXOSC|nr:methyltransferase, putative [Ixodes scapularis]|eukprot:XP_002416672.1 methyltransferase, putative [Ixodes scapularis]